MRETGLSPVKTAAFAIATIAIPETAYTRRLPE